MVNIRQIIPDNDFQALLNATGSPSAANPFATVSQLVAGVTGSGTTNYVPKFTGSTALGNSLIYDDATNIGVGISTSLGARLHVKGTTNDNTAYSLKIVDSINSNLLNVRNDGYYTFVNGVGSVMNLGLASTTSNSYPLLIDNGASTAASFVKIVNNTAIALSIGKNRNIVNGFEDSASLINSTGSFLGLASAATYPTSRNYQYGVAGWTAYSQATNDSGWAQTGADTSGNNAMYVNYIGKNWVLGGVTQGTGNLKLVVYNGTAPSTNVTSGFQLYSANVTAGNAAPHFRTENGGIIKVYQETTGVAAATLVGGGGTGITATDTFDGYTLQQIVKALRNQGLLA